MKITKNVLIESILIDRLPINPDVLALVQHLLNGGYIPPVKLQICADGGYKLKDGRHRVCAYKLIGFKLIHAKITA